MIDDLTPRPRGHDIRARESARFVQRATAGHFRRPEEVAAADESAEGRNSDEPEQESEPTNSSGAAGNQHKGKRSLKDWLKSLSKKQWIIIGVVAAVVLLGGGLGIFKLTHNAKPTPVAATIKKQLPPAPPKPTTVASNLTGLQVDPTVNQRPVTGIMIENSTFARPQSGLDEAGVVFEAIAEGGITRFLALYQDLTTPYIGPVRSVRPYYIQWGLGFDAAIAHVGGSPEGLQDMKDWHVKDLDQFANGSYYHRISSRDAPHNVYTSIAQLNDLEGKKGFGTAKFTSLARKVDEPSKTPAASQIDIKISSSDFNVHYDYDPTANSYKRSEGGAPHLELKQDGTQVQLEPHVVVALVMSQGIEADDLHTSYNTLGGGTAYIFQDGNITQANWHKASNTDNFSFTDASGQPVKLNAGQTWFTAVGNSSYVTYK